jgi:hypothetical protein
LDLSRLGNSGPQGLFIDDEVEEGHVDLPCPFAVAAWVGLDSSNQS